MLKSVAAVVGSYLLSVVLVLLTDPLLSSLFPGDYIKGGVPSDKPLIVSTALFAIISVICAVVCARFSPARPGRHVLWFFAIGEVMGVLTSVANWKTAWPHWYFLSWLIAWPICCGIGFLIGGRRAEKASPAAA